ncbi:YonK family protein [Brevibacillus laterosporus]|uniref:YonK family protein n=1 Tax=Brevibacillus laterosporus TaxID=1465 RepID=UPI002E1F5E0F|nr:YonK family protein [Brevibacillus laterosporus]MED1667148.1 YonK family protein [Brevibacillus laterosporus]MED1719784.1 YonK family protein [Brevibacillus laterosporus]
MAGVNKDGISFAGKGLFDFDTLTIEYYDKKDDRNKKYDLKEALQKCNGHEISFNISTATDAKEMDE